MKNKRLSLKYYIALFGAGLLEQFGYTLYLIAVNKYMEIVSSILMFSYMVVYLWIVRKTSTEKEGWKLIIVYSLACGIGNFIAMSMKLIK
jgi:hypothetical protein